MSTPPSAGPSPAKSRWSRMGTLVRRATLITPSRSTTTSANTSTESLALPGGKKDKKPKKQRSLDGIPTMLDTRAASSHRDMFPTPIAETPREITAAAEDARERALRSASSLQVEEPVTKPDTLAVVQSPLSPEAPSPQGYVPPPLIDSSAGNPGAFTDDSDLLPQPTVVRDPFAPSREESRTASTSSANPPPAAQPILNEDPLSNPWNTAPREESISFPRPHIAMDEPKPFFDEPLAAEPEPHTAATPYPEVAAAVETNAVTLPPASPPPETNTAAPQPLSDSPSSHTNLPLPNPHHSPLDIPAPLPNPHIAVVPASTAADDDAAHQQPSWTPKFVPQLIPTASPFLSGHAQLPDDVADSPVVEYPDFGIGSLRWSKDEDEDVATAPPAPMFSLPPTRIASRAVSDAGDGRRDDIFGGDIAKSDALDIPCTHASKRGTPLSSPPREVARSMGDRSLRIPDLQMPSPRERDAQLLDDVTINNISMPRPISTSDVFQPSSSQLPQKHTDERQPLLNPAPWVPKLQTSSSATSSLDVYPPHTTPGFFDTPTPAPIVPSYIPKTYGSTLVTLENGIGESALQGGGGEGRRGSTDRLRDRGWLEYLLPDGARYYVHPTLGLTADIDLRSKHALDDVSAWIEGAGLASSSTTAAFFSAPKRTWGTAPTDATGGGRRMHGVNGEVWIRPSTAHADGKVKAKSKKGKARKGAVFAPMVYWVDHQARTAALDQCTADEGKKKSKGRRVEEEEEEDHLDMEYRYWSFMESHTAHTTLSPSAKAQALDVLTWAWTDRLLPSQRPASSPFSQDECKELMALVRSFPSESPDDNGIQTRIVARILIRAAIWRQKHFRAAKPLPADVAPQHLPLCSSAAPQQGAGQRLANVFFGCLLGLGIPFLFVDRGVVVDEERSVHGTLGRASRTSAISAAAMVGVGAVTCLIASVVLSASITFLSFPELTRFERYATLTSVVLAGLAMATTLPAVFRAKSDEITNSRYDASPTISMRAIVLSLPVIFLAYSLAAFFASVLVYTFRGRSIFGPTHTLLNPVTHGVKWLALGAAGVAGGASAAAWVKSLTGRRGSIL